MGDVAARRHRADRGRQRRRSQQQIENLPINGRNFISFSVITPGVIDRSDAAAGRLGDVRTDVRRPARAIEQHHRRRPRQQRHRGRQRARGRSARKRCANSRCSRTPIRRSSAKPPAASSTSSPRAAPTGFAGNAFFFFRDDSAQRARATSRVRPGRARASTARRRRSSQKQFGGTLGGPIKRDKAFFFASFERLDVSDEQLRQHRRHDAHRLCPACNFGTTVRRSCSGPAFPSRRGNVPYDVCNNSLLAKARRPDGRRPEPRRSASTAADGLNENIEPFGGQVARAAAPRSTATMWLLAASHTWSSRPGS